MDAFNQFLAALLIAFFGAALAGFTGMLARKMEEWIPPAVCPQCGRSEQVVRCPMNVLELFLGMMGHMVCTAVIVVGLGILIWRASRFGWLVLGLSSLPILLLMTAGLAGFAPIYWYKHSRPPVRCEGCGWQRRRTAARE
jgi:hypothetical protein